RRGHGASADRRRRRKPRRAGSPPSATAVVHPREQHEPDPSRGLGGGRGGSRRRLGGCRRRDGDRPVSEPRTPLPRDQFIAWLRREGERRYHDRHACHVLMHEGKLTRRQLQEWVRNRYYYQTRIPIKDAIIVSKSEDPAFRRAWIRRVHDHDGSVNDGGDGGLALWLRLAEAVGLDRARVAACSDVLPGVRFACDAYVALCRESPLVVAVASSLTEMFAPDLMSRRIASWEQH